MNFIYSPALRGKAGEWYALLLLSTAIQQVVRPRVILPPAKTDAHEPRLVETSAVGVLLYARTLLNCWPSNRPIEFDAAHVEKALPSKDRDSGLLHLFEEARSYGHTVVPVVDLDALTRGLGPLYTALAAGGQLTLRLTDDDLADPKVFDEVRRHISKLGIEPRDNNLILDFGASDFSDVAITAGVLEGAIEDSLGCAPWGTITFQGSSYPKDNPADPGNGANVPRNEALAWRLATASLNGSDQSLVFGDYGADHAEVKFGPGGGFAHPHLRWAEANQWRVERGPGTGKFKVQMRQVANKLREQGISHGPGLCKGDDFVDGLINGTGGCGNSSTWRAMNMTRHITLATMERASALGISISLPEAVTSQPQPSFEFG